MAYDVVLTSRFKKELKRIAKKNRDILKDLNTLITQLSENPKLGTELGSEIYKIRMAITGSSKGKSGGARVITYVKITAQTVILTEIYLKSEYDTVDVTTVLKGLADEGYI